MGLRQKIQYPLLLLWTLLLFNPLKASNPPAPVYHIAPSHWFTGFSDSSLEIILHAENADLLDFKMDEYPGVRFEGKLNSANRHIVYLHLAILPVAKPGTLHFSAKPSSRRVRYVKSFRFNFELLPRNSTPLPVTNREIYYRLNIDRFINGNSHNDKISLKNNYDFNLRDKSARHGGDLQGLVQGLDYLSALGVTCIWISPFTENDAPRNSHNGKSVTDHYSVDPRYGNAEHIAILKSECRKKTLKLCMPLELNQVGWFHWMHLNFDTGWFHHPDSAVYPLPDPDYFSDPGISATERSWISAHWMDPAAPDLDQDNPHIRKFLLQCCLWWTETAGISAWSVPDAYLLEPGFLTYMMTAIRREFPDLTWLDDTPVKSPFSLSNIKTGTGEFGSTMNYPVLHALTPISGSDSCDPKLWSAWYDLLNYQYRFTNFQNAVNPTSEMGFMNETTFPKNPRTGLMLLAALPGNFMLQSGSEWLGNKGPANPESRLISCDQPNCLRDMQNSEEFRWTRNLLACRQKSSALSSGDLLLYVPSDAVFTFFRKSATQTVMVVCNNNKEEAVLSLNRFKDQLAPYAGFKDLITNERGMMGEHLLLPAKSVFYFELTP